MIYFNDNDQGSVRWLANAFRRDGAVVDGRSICDLKGSDLNHERVHLFAGIGGWELALRYAGWPATRPVWTGSCPCQPFSTAGPQRGFHDPRNLWPHMHRLVRECKPATVFGEQVASSAGKEWCAGVRADLEALGYAVGVADLCAASVGAPHQRQRLWWVATLGHARYLSGRNGQGQGVTKLPKVIGPGSRLGHPPVQGLEGSHRNGSTPQRVHHDVAQPGYWTEAEVIECRDGKRRRIEPGTEPVAHGVSERLVKLRGYGNAIVPQVAAVFIRSFLEAEGDICAESHRRP